MKYIIIDHDASCNIYRNTPPTENALLHIPDKQCYEYYDGSNNTFTKIPPSLALWIKKQIK